MLKRIFIVTLVVLLLFLYSCSNSERQLNSMETGTETPTGEFIEKTHPVHIYKSNDVTSVVTVGLTKNYKLQLQDFLDNNKVVGYIDCQEFDIFDSGKINSIRFCYVEKDDVYYPSQYPVYSEKNDEMFLCSIHIEKSIWGMGGFSSEVISLTQEEAMQIESFGEDLRQSFIDVSLTEDAIKIGAYVQIGKAYYFFAKGRVAPNWICIPVDDVFIFLNFYQSLDSEGYRPPESEIMNNLMNTETAPAQIDELIAKWEGKWQSFND